jgi:hypothetical protein
MDQARDDRLMQRPGTARFDAEANDRLVAEKRGRPTEVPRPTGRPSMRPKPRNSARVSTRRERAYPTTRTSRRLIQTQPGV